MRGRTGLFLSLTALLATRAFGQVAPQTGNAHLAEADDLARKGLSELRAYAMLKELTNDVGPRLAGSRGSEKAIDWGIATMRAIGLQNVRKIPCTVRRWERDAPESLTLRSGGKTVRLTACALGNSVATPKRGLTAEVVEVRSLAEVADLGERAKGKIVFLNGPMDPTLLDPFQAYSRAVGQRTQGAAAAAKVGAVGVLVRSMTLAQDDVPHTGAMRYQEGVPQIPAAAVSVVAADRLSETLRRDPRARVTLTMSCRTLPEVPSASVVGDLVGTARPWEVVVVGGHLDSWDITPGAHDDGAGVVQSLEAARLLKELGWRPLRTIRVVLFMNEENGGDGARSVAEAMRAASETAYAAIESDSGGFAPRGFGTSLSGNEILKIDGFRPGLARFGVDRLVPNGKTGADIEALAPLGAMRFGLIPEPQRYFDYHHAPNDTIDKVNPRELELGALGMAFLAWRLAQM